MELRTGTFESTLDEKGRVSIPTRLRDLYPGPELVITQGMQPSVWIMTPPVWEQFSAKLMNSADTISEEDYLDIQYQYILPAQTVELDKSSRMAVPPAIRKYAGLSRDCLVLSAENHLEIWDSESYYAYLQQKRPLIQEAMKKMGALRLFKSG
jgi:MraZ protein